MGIKGICKFLLHRLFEAFIVILLILFLPNLPPYTSISEPFSVSPAKPFEGKLSLNEKLNDVEIWHKGDFIGPEAMADYNGELYVSLYGGDVVKLTNNHITPVVKTGKPCKGHYEERICGRSLGMEFDKNGILYVADAYYGIFKVDVKTGEKTLIVSVDEEIDGKKPKLPNSIALASNGDIFWSDSSTEFLLEDGVFDLLADPSGRLIHFDARTKKNKVLIDKIHFANGVVLSDDEEFVIVAETVRNRIRRYYLKGPKKGTHDIFIDGLPGLPDNLHRHGKAGFLVPLLIAVDADHPLPNQVIGPFPRLRKLVARLFGLTQLGFELLNKVFPCEFAQKGIHFIGHFTSTGILFTPARATVLLVDKSGNIVDSLHGFNKKIGHICEAYVFKDTLYLGSPFNDYIGRIPLSKVGWEHLSTERTKREIEEQVSKTSQTSSTAGRPTPSSTTTSTPSPPSKQTPPAPPAQQTPPPPPAQQTPPPTPKPQTSPPPAKQQSSPPAPKQQTLPPPKEQISPPAPKQQHSTEPVKQQTPPPSVKQQTSPPPPSKQQTLPPPKQQTQPPSTQTPPPSNQQAPQSKLQDSTLPQQHTPPPAEKTPPPPKKQQTTPPPKQETTPPLKQTPPEVKKQSLPKEGTHTKVSNQQVPPPKQQTPPAQSSHSTAQPMKDQTKSIPVKTT